MMTSPRTDVSKVPTVVFAAAVSFGLALACDNALADDRPQAPVSTSATAVSPTQITFRFLQPTPSDLSSQWGVRFEIEQTINGQRIAHHDEARLSSMISATIPGNKYTERSSGIAWNTRLPPIWAAFDVTGLTPQADYCFRAWSRFASDGMRSNSPSAWACARTPPYPPLAPLDAKAQLRSIGDRVPTVSWSAPDMSGWRGIDGYAIERQSPPGPNRPWVPEKTVSGGPNGSPQSTAFGLAHTTTTSAIDPQQTHVYRICAVNKGGKTCAEPVALEKLAPGPQQAQQSSTAARIGAAATPSVAGPLGAPSTRTTTAQMPQATSAAAAGTGTGTVSAALRLQAALEQQRAQARPVASTLSSPGGAGTATTGAVPAPVAPAAPQPGATPQPAATPAAPANTALRITAPAAGSAVRQGQLRVQATSSGTIGARDVDVEFTYLAPKPGEDKAAAPTRLQWTVAQDQLAQGVVVPAASGPSTSGRWQMRVRPAGASAWSEPVRFDFVALSELKGRAWGRKAGELERKGLNPQPLPPKEAARATTQIDQRALNPQPLPPREITAPGSAFQR